MLILHGISKDLHAKTEKSKRKHKTKDHDKRVQISEFIGFVVGDLGEARENYERRGDFFSPLAFPPSLSLFLPF